MTQLLHIHYVTFIFLTRCDVFPAMISKQGPGVMLPLFSLFVTRSGDFSHEH